MINVPSYSAKGAPGEKVKLPEALFGIESDPGLTARAVRVFLSNHRQSSAKTKTRGEIKKTTAKMYKQKGTGRARHGSYSAPIFVGGGVAHGPDGKQNFKLKLPAAQARSALFASLSAKTKSNLAVLTGSKNINKTKEADKLLRKIFESNNKLLLVLAPSQDNVFRAFKNLERVTVSFTNNLNTYTVVRHKNLLITDEALSELTNLFNKTKK